MDIDKINENLMSALFGGFIHQFDEISSTNDQARKLAEEGAPEGSVVIAENQTQGRGKPGNVWESSPGQNILFSLILRPQLSINFVQKLTLAIAFSAVDAFNEFLSEYGYNDINFNLKWPNDILADNKKVAGILLESSVQDQKIQYITAGIGINVNQDISQLSDEINPIATSFKHILGQEIEREVLLTYLLYYIEKHYVRYERIEYRDVVESWKQYCNLFGSTAKFKTSYNEEKGIIKDLSDEGMLLYENESGETKKFISGDIILDK